MQSLDRGPQDPLGHAQLVAPHARSGAARADWPDRWQAIAEADNVHPPMTLRVNVRRTTVAAYLETLAANGIDAVALGEALLTALGVSERSGERLTDGDLDPLTLPDIDCDADAVCDANV